LTRLALVAIGAALGGAGRYLLTGLVQRSLGAPFPYGTLAVNVIGSFLAGALLAALDARLGAAPEARLFLVVGVFGGLTTFSAFTAETDALLRDGATGLALWYVAAGVGLGVVAVVAGRAVVLALGR
jgi:CrcB protein